MAHKRVVLSPSAKKSLAKLEKSNPVIAKRMRAKIESLEQSSNPSGSRNLKGRTEESLRLRVENYRAIYSCPDDDSVWVETIGHRREVYRKNKRQQR